MDRKLNQMQNLVCPTFSFYYVVCLFSVTKKEKNDNMIDLKVFEDILLTTDLKLSQESFKGMKMTSAIHLSEIYQNVSYILKRSRKAVLNREDFNADQPSTKRVCLKQDDCVPTHVVEVMVKNKQEPHATLRRLSILNEHITAQPNEQPYATMTLEGVKALECSFTGIQQGGKGRFLGEEDSDGPTKKCLTHTLSNHSGELSQFSGEDDIVPLRKESSPAAAANDPELLDDKECRHHERNNIETSRFHATDSLAKTRDQALQNSMLSMEKHHYTFTTSGAGSTQKLNRVYNHEKIDISSTTSVMHSFKENSVREPNIYSPYPDTVKSQTAQEKGQHINSKDNSDNIKNRLHLQSPERTTMLKTVQQSSTKSKTLHCLQKEKIVSEARMCVHPRDSKGRFIISASMNGKKESGSSLSHWKQAFSCKSTKPLKRSANISGIHTSISVLKETQVDIKTALSDASVGKATSGQTNKPNINLCQGRNKCLPRYKSVASYSSNDIVAAQYASSVGDLNTSSLHRDATHAISTLNHTIASTSENATNPLKVFKEKIYPDDLVRLPLNSHGSLIKLHPIAIVGIDKLHNIQNPVNIKETLVMKGSKKFPETKFVESMDTSRHVNMVDEAHKMSTYCFPWSTKCPPQQSYPHWSNQVDCLHQYSASRTNHLNMAKGGFSEVPSLDQIPSKNTVAGNLALNIDGPIIDTPDAGSILPVCMQVVARPRSKDYQSQNSMTKEKTFSKVQSLRKELLMTQPVMSLMGRNFTEGRGHEVESTLNSLYQDRNKAIKGFSEGTVGVSFIEKPKVAQTSGCITRSDVKKQFDLPDCKNARCQHPTSYAKMLENHRHSFKQTQNPETATHTSIANKELRILNSIVPTVVESTLPINCHFQGQYLKDQLCYSQQPWNFVSAFCTTLATSSNPPVSCFSSEIAVKQIDNMSHTYFSKGIVENLGETQLPRTSCNPSSNCFQNITPLNLREQVRFSQNQNYRQNWDSSSVQHALQIPECSLCGNTKAQCLHKCSCTPSQWLLNPHIQKKADNNIGFIKGQSQAPMLCTTRKGSFNNQLPCVRNSWGTISATLPYVTCVFANPTSNPTISHAQCQRPDFSVSAVKWATLKMPEKLEYSSLHFTESKSQKIAKNMSRKGNKFTRYKRSAIDNAVILSVGGKCSDAMRTEKNKNFQETEEFPREGYFRKHQECAQRSSQKSTLFPPKQKQRKSKRALNHKISSSSVSAKHQKGRELSQYPSLDGTNTEKCKLNESPFKFNMATSREDSENTFNKTRINETFLNASLQTGFPPECPQSGAFIKPNNNPFGRQVHTSKSGFHFSNAECSQFEPMKLSGGAKHILKPPSQNANAIGNQSLPTHYILPFVEASTVERHGDFKGSAHRYREE
eukprot:Gb_35550 [translate_table: standard]